MKIVISGVTFGLRFSLLVRWLTSAPASCRLVRPKNSYVVVNNQCKCANVSSQKGGAGSGRLIWWQASAEQSISTNYRKRSLKLVSIRVLMDYFYDCCVELQSCLTSLAKLQQIKIVKITTWNRKIWPIIQNLFSLYHATYGIKSCVTYLRWRPFCPAGPQGIT